MTTNRMADEEVSILISLLFVVLIKHSDQVVNTSE